MDSGWLRKPDTIIRKSRRGRKAYSLPSLDVPQVEIESVIPKNYLRESPPELPEVSESEIARHFTSLSILNHHVDRDFYPLGSCTMKYNPKISELVASYEGFTGLHPMAPQDLAQGSLMVIYELGRMLCEITGMDDVTLAPAAGAHGELTGMLIVRAYHSNRGDIRKKVLIPDSAHGTNPASVAIAGYEAVEVRSDSSGRIDIEGLRSALDETVAAIMLTNPNTLGLFETKVAQVADLVHDVGGLVYMDGANMNALMGISRPGDFGVDVVHLNLHKTFSTPHGGGGPGSGPVLVKKQLASYLPVPRVVKHGREYRLLDSDPKSIGRIHTFYGNFAVMVKAYAYILMMGAEGLRRASEDAIINANYLFSRLHPYFNVKFEGFYKHEFVLSAKDKLSRGIRTLDIAKRLMDYGFHPPTIYFPLIVEEALMIEPTETETRETLDRFVEAMIAICDEIEKSPEKVRNSPHTTPVGRVDEALAARDLDVAE
ncbi:MAG: aminomethyl-transferring glycine dehydrogenase subunit GcvPB [bacterium]